MYPTDLREMAAARLVACVAETLHGESGTAELGALYDQLDLQPTTTASYHAAAAAVHVLLAHEAGTQVADDARRDLLPPPMAIAQNPLGRRARGRRLQRDRARDRRAG